MFSRLRSFWQNFWKRAERDLDLNDEIHFHIEARTQDLIRNGLSREEAQRQGRLEFGESAIKIGRFSEQRFRSPLPSS